MLVKVLVGVALAISFSSSARASCIVPRFSVVWSSPADGDTNVPLDASMLLLTTLRTMGMWRATIEGREVEPSAEGQYAD